ncbi:MAG TPA: allantoinase AllB, partial [Candidatus Eisenbacteria bacterium]|nr:allantoinase AllB [Candidatus Eisenbacteria bacterium]
DERVVAMGPGLDLAGAAELDAAGLHVFPGGVDPHVHFNEPGRTEWEGIATGSEALAAGGFTTYADMPLNSLPVTTEASAFDRKRAAAEAASHVDFGLWAGLVPGNAGSTGELEALARRGALGFKAFLCDSGIPEFPAADDLTLAEGMRRCAELDSIVLVHAESSAMVAGLTRRAVAAGRLGARDFAAARPALAELEAISRALFLAGETGCALHVVHVSTARGVELVERARAAGVDASCETCPHYLLLTADDAEELGAIAKCAPPLRPAPERDRLWRLVEQGVLPIVASDHSPCPAELKAGDDFFRAWGGISGCQSTLNLLLARGGLPLGTVAAVTACNAARRFRLAGKGAIEPGADADLALVDLERTWELRQSELRYRHRHCPYIGRPVRGRVVRTLLRGTTVMRDGALVGAPAGRLLARARRRQVSGDQSTW